MSPIQKIVKRGKIYHVYYRRTGGYHFLGKNFVRLIIGILIFGAAIWALNTYVFDIKAFTEKITHSMHPFFVVATMFISEIGTGMLPPDLFILWAGEGQYPWLMVTILATVSYLGGWISWYLGTGLYKLPKIHDWVDVKFREQFKQLKRFGGLLIFLAALTPLPFAPVSVIAGVVRFPMKTYLIVALSRFLRFYLYAALIFGLV